MITLQHYLVVSAALFSLGILGLLTRRNAVHVLMSIELILNAANVNLVAFSRFAAGNLEGQVFGVFVIVVAASEVAVGLFVILASTAVRTQWMGMARPPAPTTAEIGRLFLGQYLLPFEAASVLLLVALMGAAMIVRRRRDA